MPRKSAMPPIGIETPLSGLGGRRHLRAWLRDMVIPGACMLAGVAAWLVARALVPDKGDPGLLLLPLGGFAAAYTVVNRRQGTRRLIRQMGEWALVATITVTLMQVSVTAKPTRQVSGTTTANMNAGADLLEQWAGAAWRAFTSRHDGTPEEPTPEAKPKAVTR